MNAWRSALEWLGNMRIEAAEEKQSDPAEVPDRARSARSYLMKWGGADGKGMEADEADAELLQIAKERRLPQRRRHI